MTIFCRVASYLRDPPLQQTKTPKLTLNPHARSDGNDDRHLYGKIAAPGLWVPLQELPEHRVHLHHPLVCPRHVRDGELDIEQHDNMGIRFGIGRELPAVPSLLIGQQDRDMSFTRTKATPTQQQRATHSSREIGLDQRTCTRKKYLRPSLPSMLSRRWENPCLAIWNTYHTRKKNTQNARVKVLRMPTSSHLSREFLECCTLGTNTKHFYRNNVYPSIPSQHALLCVFKPQLKYRSTETATAINQGQDAEH